MLGEKGKHLIFSEETLCVDESKKGLIFNGNLYTYSQVFDSDSTQKDVYNHACKEAIQQMFNGYNASIFVYGCSGSGKTFTILGPNEAIDAFSKKEYLENGKS